jgi:hypothetical protein
MPDSEVKVPEDLRERVKGIVPGHPIWDEVWCKSRPGAGHVSHLDQLFIAKLDLARVEQERDQLRASHAELMEQLTLLVDSIEDGGGHDENGDVFHIQPACEALERAQAIKNGSQVQAGNRSSV